MTPEQMALYIELLQFGFATGAVSRFDCLRAFIHAYPDQKSAAIAAAFAFERGCCYCPEQELTLAGLSDESFAAWLVSGAPV
ncbi:MAG: hypothetical protein IGS50_12505 [Synechococcales cyanobacterium C42_A2020_086]|jgi:hypothetical protein|nr:hypothetical protein [Synechococcales cyanobacterium C42_A2020_086]